MYCELVVSLSSRVFSSVLAMPSADSSAGVYVWLPVQPARPRGPGRSWAATASAYSLVVAGVGAAASSTGRYSTQVVNSTAACWNRR
jgi:hypothetical protein